MVSKSLHSLVPREPLEDAQRFMTTPVTVEDDERSRELPRRKRRMC